MVNAGGSHDGLLDGICLLALTCLDDVLEVPRRDEEDAETENICE